MPRKKKKQDKKKESENSTITSFCAMGACASSPSAKTTAASVNKGGGGGAPASESFRRPSSIMVMDMLGRIKEYKQPIPARNVLSENPHFYLCNSETVHIGTCMPRIPDEEELLPGRIYFLVPLSHSDSPLSLPLLCDLAVKAGSALPNPNNNSYYGHRTKASVTRR